MGVSLFFHCVKKKKNSLCKIAWFFAFYFLDNKPMSAWPNNMQVDNFNKRLLWWIVNISYIKCTKLYLSAILPCATFYNILVYIYHFRSLLTRYSSSLHEFQYDSYWPTLGGQYLEIILKWVQTAISCILITISYIFMYVPFRVSNLVHGVTDVNHVVDRVQWFFFNFLITDPKYFKAPKLIIIVYVVNFF